MKFYKSYLIFIFINFSALGIGTWLMNDGPRTEWYTNLNQAPWSPPGWVFGVAWTFIMICFAVYMAYLIDHKTDRKKIIILFAIQWVLNISWNPVFFYFQEVLLGMINISLLTILIGYLFFSYRKELKVKSIFIVPYLIWLMIATSLNGYILLNNF